MKFFLFLYPVLILFQSADICSHVNADSSNIILNERVKTNQDMNVEIEQIFLYTNKEREKANLQPLVKNDKLMTVAANYAALMAKEGELSHEVDGKAMPVRYAAVNYVWRYIGENVAANSVLSGQSTVEDQWMHSSGHKANILNERFKEIGIGIAYSAKQNIYYYCQDFGEPR